MKLTAYRFLLKNAYHPLLIMVGLCLFATTITQCKKQEPWNEDEKKPDLTLVQPTDNGTTLAGETIRIIGTATDDYELAQLKVTIAFDQTGEQTVRTTPLTGKEASIDMEIDLGITFFPQEKLYGTYRLELSDRNGNTSMQEIPLILQNKEWNLEYTAVIERTTHQDRYLHILDTNFMPIGASQWIGDTNLIVAAHSTKKLLLVGNPQTGTLTAYKIPTMQVQFSQQFPASPGLKAITDIAVSLDSTIYLTSEIAPYIHHIGPTGHPRHLPITLYQPATAVSVHPKQLLIATYEAPQQQGRLKAFNTVTGNLMHEYGFSGYALDIDWTQEVPYPKRTIAMVYWDPNVGSGSNKTIYFDQYFVQSPSRTISDGFQQIISTPYRYLLPTGTQIMEVIPPWNPNSGGHGSIIQSQHTAADYDHEAKTIYLANQSTMEQWNMAGQLLRSFSVPFQGEVEGIYMIFNK